MKNFARPIAVLLLVFAVQTEAHASAGLLTTPGIAARAGSPAAEAQKVLQAPKYKFVTGMFINWYSTLYYTGDAKNLSSFVNDLALVKGAEVTVRFSKAKGWADTTVFGKAGKATRCEWMLSHDGNNNFGITVYLGGDEFDIENLRLPPLKPDPSSVKDRAADRKTK